MIRAFLFDYDGVITRGVADSTLWARLAANLGISEKLAAAWIGSISAPRLKGQLSRDEMWRFFEQQYGKPISVEQRDIWFKWEELKPLPEMIGLVQGLKLKGYPVGLLSNASTDTRDIIQKHGGYDAFDFTVISSDVGYRKPDAEIYKIALAKLSGIKPSEVLFLDDRKTGIVAADKLGIKTILVADHSKAIDEVEYLINSSYEQT
jgi:epoxide hydrolase-like predicted phosphatase